MWVCAIQKDRQRLVAIQVTGSILDEPENEIQILMAPEPIVKPHGLGKLRGNDESRRLESTVVNQEIPADVLAFVRRTRIVYQFLGTRSLEPDIGARKHVLGPLVPYL